MLCAACDQDGANERYRLSLGSQGSLCFDCWDAAVKYDLKTHEEVRLKMWEVKVMTRMNGETWRHKSENLAGVKYKLGWKTKKLLKDEKAYNLK